MRGQPAYRGFALIVGDGTDGAGTVSTDAWNVGNHVQCVVRKHFCTAEETCSARATSQPFQSPLTVSISDAAYVCIPGMIFNGRKVRMLTRSLIVGKPEIVDDADTEGAQERGEELTVSSSNYSTVSLLLLAFAAALFPTTTPRSRVGTAVRRSPHPAAWPQDKTNLICSLCASFTAKRCVVHFTPGHPSLFVHASVPFQQRDSNSFDIFDRTSR